MANNVISLTASNIKYLLVIFELDHNGHGVRCTDIAEILHVTKPSVHRTAAVLKEMQLIHKDKYGAVFLTEIGKALSARYIKCCEVLHGYFKQLLPAESDIKSVCCSILAQLPLEDVEHMCINMLTGQICL